MRLGPIKMYQPLDLFKFTEGIGDSRPIAWVPNGDLVVSLGGSSQTIYRQEIERRLR